MKSYLFLAACLMGAVHSAHAAVVTAAISGNVGSPTVTGGADLDNLSYAVLVIDGSGDGIEFSNPLTLTEGSAYGTDNFVASIFASTNSFFGVAAASPGVNVSYDDSAPAGPGINAGDQFYVIWFEGTGGTADNSDTSFDVTAGMKYFYATGATLSEWQVGAGGSTVNGEDAGAFSGATVVPEPSTLLLSAFGILGLLRRKR